MTTETIEAEEAEPGPTRRSSPEQTPPPQEPTPLAEVRQLGETTETVKFYGGVYGLGAVALTAMASRSREPYRTVENMLKKHKGVGGLVGYLSTTIPQANGMADPDFPQNMVRVLENFYHPTTLNVAHEIAQQSSEESYCNSIDIGTVAYNTPAVIAALDREPWREELKNTTGLRNETSGALEQKDTIIDIVGTKSLVDSRVHSVPTARNLLTPVFGDRLRPYVLDSASLLLGISMGIIQQSNRLKILDRDSEGNPKISSVSY